MQDKKRTSRLLPLIIISILGLSVYFNSLGGDFVWDDNTLIVENSYIKSPAKIPKLFLSDIGAGAMYRYTFYRPLQVLSYLIDYSIWKLDVFGYHLTNLLLHIMAAWLVYRMALMLGLAQKIAFLAGALFVVHPVHTEAVAYISGRADILAAIFILLCVVFHIKHTAGPSGPALALVYASYVLALLSKEYGMITPFLLLLYNAVFRKKVIRREFLVLFMATLVYFLLRMAALDPVIGFPNKSTLIQRLPGSFAAIGEYLKLLFVPFNLHMAYGKEPVSFADPRVIFGAAVSLILLVYAFISRKSQKAASFCVAWFILGLVPVLNLYPINAYMAEHWLYIPSIGFFIIMAKCLVSLQQVARLRYIITMAAGVIILFYSYSTIKQNKYWSDELTFYKETLKYAPNNAKLYVELGVKYASSGNRDNAIRCYRRAIELDPRLPQAYNNLGVEYIETGRLKEAADTLNKGLEINPKLVFMHHNMGVAYERMGDRKRSLAEFKKAIELNPESYLDHLCLGNYLLDEGLLDEASKECQLALKINPRLASAHWLAGKIYYRKKLFSEAVESFGKVLDINPRSAVAYFHLGLIYKEMGRKEDAKKAWEKALKLDPKNEDARKELKQQH